MNSPNVAVAYLHPGEVSAAFLMSLLKLMLFETGREGMPPLVIANRCSSGAIVSGRNEVARDFLDRTEASWLLFVDADMGFDADALKRLMEAADRERRPIVGGLCFALRRESTDPDTNAERFRTQPTVYQWRETDELAGFEVVADYPRDKVIAVGATGAAFLLIHRRALEAIREKFGAKWFEEAQHPKAPSGRFSEDMSFCIRAQACGLPVHVHTGVKTCHDKGGVFLDEDYFDRQQHLTRTYDQPTPLRAPPAVDEVDVLVPVLGRPQNAAPFMRSLRASTGLARVTAIAEEDDTVTVLAWKEAGAEVALSSARSFARKVNEAYPFTRAPWVFLVGDDVEFHPGWLDEALHVAATTGAQVIGTNDLGNPHVVAGDHATHMLIRRSYIDELGASWDGPGVVCHEGYGHCFVDNEIVAAAKQRDVWASAPTSIVEHLHPEWGKGNPDGTYERGQATRDADQALFEQRLDRHTVEVT